MAQDKQAKKVKKQAKAAQRARPREGSMVLGRRNALLIVAGIVVIIIGYMLLGRGSVTAAPLLLVIGYCVVVPVAIVMWTRKPNDKRQSGTGE
jgi:hypothetical protein